MLPTRSPLGAGRGLCTGQHGWKAAMPRKARAGAEGAFELQCPSHKPTWRLESMSMMMLALDASIARSMPVIACFAQA
jgi:hypothetical protein